MQKIKYKILTIFTFLSIWTYGQIDTLTVNFTSTYPYLFQSDSITNYKGHRLSIDLINVLPNFILDNSGKAKKVNKRFKREVEAYIANVNKKLSEVKVLYVLHPTANNPFNTKESEPVDSLYATIYRLDFTKLTSLEVVYLVGDDLDYILDFPYAFYKTPVKIIHCAQITYYEKLKQNVLKKNKNIQVLRDTQQDRDYYIQYIQK